MSIVPLVKVTLLGLSSERRHAIAATQRFGCLHLIDLVSVEEGVSQPAYRTGAMKAFKYLSAAPMKRRPVRQSRRFDPDTLTREALALQDRAQTLEHDRDLLHQRIREVEAWGDFDFAPLAEMGGNRLWFYRIPHYRLKKLEGREDLIWESVGRDNRFTFVAVIGPEEPEDMPVVRSHIGEKSLSTLTRELEELEIELEDIAARRHSLTRWLFLLGQCLAAAEDRSALDRAHQGAYDDGAVFALQGWMGTDQLDELTAFARETGLAVSTEPVGEDDRPPTLLRNPDLWGGGEEVIKFYSMPGYRTVDPSLPLFLFFALFFAMILSDAGYAAVLGLILWFSWGGLRKSKAGRRIGIMLGAIVGASTVWGVLVGSYFGVAPPPESPLGWVHLLDMDDTETMMGVSVAVGIIHVIAGNLMVAWHRRADPAALAPIGWVLMVLGGLVLGLALGGIVPALELVGWAGLALGALLVAVFSEWHRGMPHTPVQWILRVLGGFGALTRITQAFGDVLSYLRLFALGLASGSLAVTFNALAVQAAEDMPGIGMLLAALTLIVGHVVNFAIGLMGGVVHGLRLNVIEFFNWAVSEEGYPFKVFHRKEGAVWTPSS